MSYESTPVDKIDLSLSYIMSFTDHPITISAVHMEEPTAGNVINTNMMKKLTGGDKFVRTDRSKPVSFQIVITAADGSQSFHPTA